MRNISKFKEERKEVEEGGRGEGAQGGRLVRTKEKEWGHETETETHREIEREVEIQRERQRQRQRQRHTER